MHSIIRNIRLNGCSIKHVQHLSHMCSLLFKQTNNVIDLSFVNDVLRIPFFCDDVHVLFDIVLSGMLMKDNSPVSWAKFIFNRLLWRKQCTDYHIFHSNDVVEYIQALCQRDIAVEALFRLQDIMVPDFVESMEDIVSIRRLFKNTLSWLNDSFESWVQSPLINPVSTIPIFSKLPAFFLTYHDCNNATLLRLQAMLYSKILKHVFRLDSLDLCKHQRTARKRIGFVSRALNNHSVGKISIGLVEHLHNNGFEVYLYTTDQRMQIIGEKFASSCHKYTNPSNKLMDWVKQIKQDELDILCILDPIVDINVYLIGCFRLAPIQITTWGHPDTSGLPYIDYYVSSRMFESYIDDMYTEELVRFDSMGIIYYHIDDFLQFNSMNLLRSVGRENIRNEYGFSGNIYCIAGNLIKIYPVMDTIIDKILQQDTDAYVVLITGKDNVLFDKVRNRLQRNVKFFNRIKFVSQQPDVFQFLKLVYASDVILDTHPFGGCITTLECFMVGKCVVTLPGNKLYGRFTQGFYKKIGIPELVATCVDDYVDTAIRVANNVLFRTLLENNILDKLSSIIKDQDSANEWLYFLLKCQVVAPRLA